MAGIKIPIHENFLWLLKPSRYKVCPGARGRGASWNYARALLFFATLPNIKINVSCFRFLWKSIETSTYTLLRNQIEILKLNKYFDPSSDKIKCRYNDSEFRFFGLNNNIDEIKSNAFVENSDIADVEEAENVTEEIWQEFIPTIRKENKTPKTFKMNGENIQLFPSSEIWLRFNVKFVDDATYQRFYVNPPSNASVHFMTWRDNVDFPKVLEEEKNNDFANRPSEAKNIWDGVPVGTGRKIYPEFLEKVHVREFDFAAIRDKAQCFMAIDPAQKYYPACLWLAQWPNGAGGLTRWIFNEWPGTNDLPDWFHKCRKTILYPGSLADMSREIYAHDRNDVGMRVSKRAIDTRFAKGSGSGSFYSGDTQGLVSEFAKRENGGLKFECPWEKAIDMQRSNIVKDLQYNTLLALTSYNEPNLFIAPWCLNTIQSLKNHRLEEDSEKESEMYKDFSDALRICYAAMDNVTYKNASGQGQAPAPKVSPLYVGIGSGSMAGSSTSWLGA
jgi:phage terminase large subunit